MDGLKESRQALGGVGRSPALQEFAPPTILAQASRLNFSGALLQPARHQRPGPAVPALRARAASCRTIFPIPFLAGERALAIAIISYDGKVGFGLLGDYDALPDLDVVAEGIEASLAQLVALARDRLTHSRLLSHRVSAHSGADSHIHRHPRDAPDARSGDGECGGADARGPQRRARRAVGKADLRSVAWDVGATSAKLTVGLDASTFGSTRALIGVHVLIDADSDSIADHEVVATRNADGVKVDVALRDLDRTLSTPDCQDLAGKGAGPAGTVATTIAGGRETFSFSFDPNVLPGHLASFRWAAFGQAPPDAAASGPWDVMPDAANPDPGAANPGDRRCNSAKSGVRVRMKSGVAFPDPSRRRRPRRRPRAPRRSPSSCSRSPAASRRPALPRRSTPAAPRRRPARTWSPSSGT